MSAHHKFPASPADYFFLDLLFLPEAFLGFSGSTYVQLFPIATFHHARFTASISFSKPQSLKLFTKKLITVA